MLKERPENSGSYKSPLDSRQVIENTRRLINAGRMAWLESLGIDLVVGERKGCYVWSVEGEQYIDVLCDGTTFNFGHRNSHLIETLCSLLEKYDIGCQFLASGPRAELAELLVKKSPEGLNHVHFLPSGSEANDAAIKCATLATGRNRVVSISGGFHGVTGLAAKATGGNFAEPVAGALQGSIWAQVEWNDTGAMQRALAKEDVAAVLIETIPAALGWPMPNPDYLADVRELCTRYGTMLIVDEVQTGLGRCGYLWAIEHWNVIPDMLVMAKGAGGGLYPLAYVLMTDKAAEWTQCAPLTMPSTFGGSELGCALGLEVVQMASNAAFLEKVRERAQYLRTRLDALQQKYGDTVVAVNQLGLAAAIKFDDPAGGLKMMQALFEKKVLSIAASEDVSVIQIKPPLIISYSIIDQLIDAIDASIRRCFITREVNLHPDALAPFVSQA